MAMQRPIQLTLGFSHSKRKNKQKKINFKQIFGFSLNFRYFIELTLPTEIQIKPKCLFIYLIDLIFLFSLINNLHYVLDYN